MNSFLALVFVLPVFGSSQTCVPEAQDPETKLVEVVGFDHTHKAWSTVLAAHVHDDAFDYKGLKKDRAGLDAYIATLAAVTAEDFGRWNKSRRYAYWINAYNAYTIQRVVDGYPVASIKDLGDEKLSVWDREFIPLGALAPDLKKSMLTLNDIENKILRPVFKDARVHAAINCASVGCPPIRAEAYVGDTLDKQLDASVKAWLTDSRRNRFDADKKLIEVSQVFDWFKDDFIRDAGSVTAWLAKHAPDQKWLADAKRVELKFLDYSWKLNDKRP
ncbi:MAG: DUF547 domain-containing protein [Planctomycetes bacterium]|nr:DUF547 domain-containing protein [Planctomycetota bacterium]